MNERDEDSSAHLLAAIRSKELQQLHDAFGTGTSTSKSLPLRRAGHKKINIAVTKDKVSRTQPHRGKAVVVCGLSGIGKSSMASRFAEQAQRNGHYKRGVYRLNAASAATLQASMRDVLMSLGAGYASCSSADPTSAAFWGKTMGALHPTSERLFILENADSEDFLMTEGGQLSGMWRHLLPNATFPHHLLIITQCSVLPAGLAKAIDLRLQVSPLTTAQSMWLLAQLRGSLCKRCHWRVPATPRQVWRQLRRGCKPCHSASPLPSLRSCCSHCLSRADNGAHADSIALGEAKFRGLPTRCCDHRRDCHRECKQSPCCFQVFSELLEGSDGACGIPVALTWIAGHCGRPGVEESSTCKEPGMRDVPVGYDSAGAGPDGGTPSLRHLWKRVLKRMSVPARQLLNVAAFLNPDQISYDTILTGECGVTMPPELYCGLFHASPGRADSTVLGPRSTSESILSLQTLLCELQQLSLIAFISNPSDKRPQLKRTAGGGGQPKFRIHRLVQQLVLADLYGRPTEFRQYLCCALEILQLHEMAAPSTTYVEENVVPHIAQLNPVSLIKLGRRCGFIHPQSDVGDVFQVRHLHLDTDIQQRWAILLHTCLNDQFYNHYMLKYCSSDILQGLGLLLVSLSDDVQEVSSCRDTWNRFTDLTLRHQKGGENDAFYAKVFTAIKFLPREFSLAVVSHLRTSYIRRGCELQGGMARDSGTFISVATLPERICRNPPVRCSASTHHMIRSLDYTRDLLMGVDALLCILVASQGNLDEIHRSSHFQQLASKQVEVLNELYMAIYQTFTTAQFPASQEMGIKIKGGAQSCPDDHREQRIPNAAQFETRPYHRPPTITDLTRADVQVIQSVHCIEELCGGSYLSGLEYIPLVFIALYLISAREIHRGKVAFERLLCCAPAHFPLSGCQLYYLLFNLFSGEPRGEALYLPEDDLYD